MFILPLATNDHKNDLLVVVLDSAGMARMRQADPAQVHLRTCGQLLVNPTVMICLEEDQAALEPVLRSRNVQAILQYLNRGWRFRPEAGDNDDPPQPFPPAGEDRP